MTSKKYLVLNSGICYNPEGWTEEQLEQFMDKVIEVAESFGKDVQFTQSFELKTEEEVENDQQN